MNETKRIRKIVPGTYVFIFNFKESPNAKLYTYMCINTNTNRHSKLISNMASVGMAPGANERFTRSFRILSTHVNNSRQNDI